MTKGVKVWGLIDAFDTDYNGMLDSFVEYNQTLIAWINAPSYGSIFSKNDTIVFNGSVYNGTENGTAPYTFTWISDICGFIGNGSLVKSATLPSGDHNITLMVQDSVGLTDNDTIRITVNPSSVSVSGTITYACNGTAIEEATVKLTQGGVIVDSTTTDASGDYEFTDVTSGDYYVNASKSGFWENAAAVTVTGGATTTADMMLWLKGDLNNNGAVDIGDVAKVANMVVGNVPKDPQADFNGNGDVDIGDAAKIANYFVGNIGAL